MTRVRKWLCSAGTSMSRFHISPIVYVVSQVASARPALSVEGVDADNLVLGMYHCLYLHVSYTWDRSGRMCAFFDECNRVVNTNSFCIPLFLPLQQEPVLVGYLSWCVYVYTPITVISLTDRVNLVYEILPQ